MGNASDHSSGVSVSQAVRVAIVDDDMFVRTTMRELLNGQPGIEVIDTYPTGSDAVVGIQERRPDVVLVDVEMPHMDGVEITRQIRSLAPGVQVLALTSFTDERTVSRMLRAGALGFLFKDLPVATIAEATRAAKLGLSVLSAKASAPLASGSADQESVELNDLERQVVALVCQGLGNEEIAAELYISVSTVKYYINSLKEKLGASSRVSLAVRATRFGLG